MSKKRIHKCVELKLVNYQNDQNINNHIYQKMKYEIPKCPAAVAATF